MSCSAAAASVSPELPGDHGATADQPPTDCDRSAAATAALGTASHLHTNGGRASMNADATATYSYMPSLHSSYTHAHDDAMMLHYEVGEAPWESE